MKLGAGMKARAFIKLSHLTENNQRAMKAESKILNYFGVEFTTDIHKSDLFKILSVRTSKEKKEGRKVTGYYVDQLNNRLMIVEKTGVLTYDMAEENHLTLSKIQTLHTL